MNVRKPADYGTIYRKLTAILPQMDEVYAIGKVISQRSEKGTAVVAADSLQANFLTAQAFPHATCAGCAIFIRPIKMTKSSYGRSS